MQHKRFEDMESLAAFIKGIGGGVLFRGQTSHYTTDGRIEIKPSQHRKGCIPSMLRVWTHYIVDGCRRLTAKNELIDDVELMQALLQHYGWRSFFIDASASASVAAWFAGRAYRQRVLYAACRDCYDEDVLLRQEAPTYAEHQGDGHLYVLSRTAVEAKGTKCIDLCGRLQSDFRTRFVAQAAWLIGPMREPLLDDCIVAHVEAPARVFREMAKEAQLDATPSLFPPRTEDLMLKILLSAPWTRIGAAADAGPGAYRRTLMLPEYDFTFIKRRPSSEAFVDPFWVAARRPGSKPGKAEKAVEHRSLNDVTFFRISEDILYLSKSDRIPRLPKFLAMLKKEEAIIIETDGIIRLSDDLEGSEYDKGVSVELIEPNLIEVSAVFVEHPGTQVLGVGVNRPWFYSFDTEGNLQYIEREGQCTCKDPWRHRHHLEVLVRFESVISSFVKLGKRDYRYESTRPVPVEDLLRQRPR